MSVQGASRPVGTWNVEYGHNVAHHVRVILDLFTVLGLHVFMLQEMRDYRTALAEAAEKAGYFLVHFGPDPDGDHDRPARRRDSRHRKYLRGMDQQCILVRDPDLIWRQKHPQTRRRQAWAWVFPAGTPFGQFLAMFPVAVVYDGTMFVSVHAPVGAKMRHGRFTGPASRVLATVTHLAKLGTLIVWCKAKGLSLVIGGDWNCVVSEKRKGTPSALAAKHGGLVAAPTESTGHGIIDYFLTFACRMRNVHVVSAPAWRVSDHLPVVGDLYV